MTDELPDVDPVPQAAVDALTPRAGLDAWGEYVPVKPEDPANATAPIALTVGRRPLQAPGARAPRRAADVAALDAGQRANWLLTGPRGAAKVLGLHANTLRSRMKKLGIARPAH